MAYEDDSPYPVNQGPTPGTGVQDQEQPNTHLPNIIPPGQDPLAGIPTAPATQGQGGGGFDFGNFLQQFLGNGVGFNLGTMIPALTHAYSQWKNADKYGETAERAAGMASPVDTATRQRYQQRLDQFYTDPTAFLEGNPEFMANKRLGEAALFAKNNAMGLGGSGKATNDQLRFLSDLSSRYVGQERKDLMHMGGFQFDPATGAQMLMKGNDQEIAAKNSALAALAYMFGGNQGGGPAGGGGQNGGGGIMDILRQVLGGGRSGGGQSGGTPGINPTSLLQFISTLPGSSLPPELFQQLGMDQNPFNTDMLTQLGLSNSGFNSDTLQPTQDFGGGMTLDDIINQATGGGGASGIPLQDSIGDTDPLTLIFGGGGDGGFNFDKILGG